MQSIFLFSTLSTCSSLLDFTFSGFSFFSLHAPLLLLLLLPVLRALLPFPESGDGKRGTATGQAGATRTLCMSLG